MTHDVKRNVNDYPVIRKECRRNTMSICKVFINIMKIYLSWIIFFTGCCVLSISSDVPTFNLKVPPLIAPSQPDNSIVNSVRLWNDQIIIEKPILSQQTGNWIKNFFVYDRINDNISLLKIDNVKEIIDLADDGNSILALCRMNNKIFLKKKEHNKWKDLPISQKIANDKKFRIATINNLIFIIDSESIFYRDKNFDWNNIAIQSFTETASIKEYMPSHILATDNSLYLGWNLGEFGGRLLCIPFSLSRGRIIFHEGFSPLQKPITGIAKISSNEIFISTGQSHPIVRGNLYSFDNRNLRLLAKNCSDIVADKCLPMESSIDAVCKNLKGIPLVLAPDIGVFTIINDKIVWQLKADMNFQFEGRMQDGKYEASTNPFDMALDNDSNIYIATKFLGIFAFFKQRSGYQFKQIIVDNYQ